uniref:Putative secreted protein n=1 Tax=Panstrongylus lignarius TaxID=156445 RepID=A0A224Y779_9HEMI
MIRSSFCGFNLLFLRLNTGDDATNLSSGTISSPVSDIACSAFPISLMSHFTIGNSGESITSLSSSIS